MKLTEAAIEKALVMRPDENTCLRVAVMGGGCAGLMYQLSFDDIQRDDDNVMVCGELKVLIDPKSALYLANTTLDYVDGLNESGFKFTNPDATGTCGCGSSFGCP